MSDSPFLPCQSTLQYHFSRFHVCALNMIFIFLFLTYFSLYNRLQFHPPLKLTHMHSFLWLSNIPLCICTTTSLTIHLLMDIQVASMFQLLKILLQEQWDTHVFFSFGFLRLYALEWDCWVIWWFYSQLFKESPQCLPQWLYQFMLSPTVQGCSLFSTPSSHLLFIDILMMIILTELR